MFICTPKRSRKISVIDIFDCNCSCTVLFHQFWLRKDVKTQHWNEDWKYKCEYQSSHLAIDEHWTLIHTYKLRVQSKITMADASVIVILQNKATTTPKWSERTRKKEKVINLLHLNLLCVCVCACAPTVDIECSSVRERLRSVALIFPTVFYWISIINYNFKR